MIRTKRFAQLLLLLVALVGILNKPSFAVSNYGSDNLPSYGFQLVVDGEGGEVSLNGTILQSGHVEELDYGTPVALTAAPDNGYAVKEWTCINVKNGNARQMGNQNLTYFATNSFYEIHVSFEQKEVVKLYCNTMYGTDDVTLSNNCFLVYKVSPDVPLEVVFDDLDSFVSANLESIVTDVADLFSHGLDYYTIDCDGSWYIFVQDLYPCFDYSRNKPVFLGTGFSVSDEEMIVQKKTIRSATGDFSGYNIVVINPYGDVHVSSEIRDIELTSLTVDFDNEKGNVSISPKRHKSPNYWYEETSITVQAKPKEGYRFVRWEGETNSVINDSNEMVNPLTFVIGSQDMGIKAVFESAVAHLRPITVESSPANKAVVRINGDEGVTEVEEGSTVLLSVDVDEYYLFDHWEVYQNGVDNQENLVVPEKRLLTEADFEMPYGEGGVTVKAVLNIHESSINQYVNIEGLTFFDIQNYVQFSFGVNGVECTSRNVLVHKGDTVTVDVEVLDDVYGFSSLQVVKNLNDETSLAISVQEPHLEFTVEDWAVYSVYCVLVPNEIVIKPVIINESAVRTGENTATVTFYSDTAGTYYYIVHEIGYWQEVATSEAQIGYTATEGLNTVFLNTLSGSSGKWFFIKIKSIDGVDSDQYTIDIPAFEENQPDVFYDIKVNAPEGGSIVPNVYQAKEGDIIYLTLIPNEGMHLTEGSLSYSLSSSGGGVVQIIGNSFIMPGSDITLSCKWEKDMQPIQDDITAAYWRDIITSQTANPWWVYAEEQLKQGNYPVYW